MTITIGRRELIAALGGAAAWSHAARAQQPKVPTIGALVIGNITGRILARVSAGTARSGVYRGTEHSI